MEKRIKSKPITAKFAAALIALWIFIFGYGNSAFADLLTFQKGYTYQASEADSKISSRAIALEQVKRLLLEELGTYLESQTEVKNFQLTKDQITVLTAGIVRAEVINEKWDGKTYYLKAKITADPKDVANSIDKLRQDRQKIRELEETRKKADEALREIEKLKKELELARAERTKFGQYDGSLSRSNASAKGIIDPVERISKYNDAVNRLSAADWLAKGYALGNAGNWQEAREAFTRALELNPKYAVAHHSRGAAYDELGDYHQALRDFDRSIELDPKDAWAYLIRGAAYDKYGDYRQAIRDYNRAIELDPKLAGAYYNRGTAYGKLGDYRQAIRDCDRAIELEPKDAKAYLNRGAAYSSLGDYQQALRDFDRATELDPKDAMAYSNRGFAYTLIRR
jgi:tetratricopeptide (TPR) repeat protein